MNYQQFVTSVSEQVNYLFDSKTTAKIHTALKNNDTQRIGLVISEEDTNISPTIYLEDFYEQYQQGNSIEGISEAIVSIYHQIKFDNPIETTLLENFEELKPFVTFRLIHRSRNYSLLETIPFIPFLDLAIVFSLLFEMPDHGLGSITITNNMIELWDTSLSELYRLAVENTASLFPIEFRPLKSAISEMTGMPYDQAMFEDDHLYILTNSICHLGAACILYTTVLEDIADILEDDFYLIPCSIHEIIILPASYSPEIVSLNEMIQEINSTQLSADEILSDHCYFYDRKKQLIS